MKRRFPKRTWKNAGNIKPDQSVGEERKMFSNIESHSCILLKKMQPWLLWLYVMEKILLFDFFMCNSSSSGVLRTVPLDRFGRIG